MDVPLIGTPNPAINRQIKNTLGGVFNNTLVTDSRIIVAEELLRADGEKILTAVETDSITDGGATRRMVEERLFFL